uniref:Solute carrier family 25 member 32 n=1 Tax=Xiphophorus couchianus TaxID=32473 RepID=A0A3B5MNM0_9TELE
LTLTITNPIWVTKTRLVLQYSSDPTSKQYKGMVDALVKIYRHEGLPGLYKGYVPGLFGTSHGALQFMAYEELKRDYNKYKKVPSDAKLDALEYVTMAALSKIFAVATTYPYQVVRARLQDQHNRYGGVVDVIGRTWRNEGASGFYKGVVPNLIRVTPACCITFVVYENRQRGPGMDSHTGRQAPAETLETKRGACFPPQRLSLSTWRCVEVRGKKVEASNQLTHFRSNILEADWGH